MENLWEETENALTVEWQTPMSDKTKCRSSAVDTFLNDRVENHDHKEPHVVYVYLKVKFTLQMMTVY